MVKLGEKLRALRQEHCLTQLDVALKLDIGYSTYRNFEADSIIPKAKELIGLAELYNVSVDYILGIGTTMTLCYDKQDLQTLREAISSMLPAKEKAVKIKEALTPLLNQRNDAFAPPNLTPGEIEKYVGSTIKTVRFDAADDKLIMDALQIMYDLLWGQRKLEYFETERSRNQDMRRTPQ